MRKTRTPLTVAALAVLALGLGCRGKEALDTDGPTPARTARAEKATLLDRVQLSGRVVPPIDRDATLSPLVAGRILSVDVRQGDRVEKGQRLAGLDTAPFDDAVSSAEAADRRAVAEMEFRQREAQRTRSLFERGVSSRQDAESDEAAAVSAESARIEASTALADARRRRQWAELRAPFDGIVLRVMRSGGEQVDGTSGTPVVEVAAEMPVEVASDATAAVLPRIASGDDAEIAVGSGNAEGSLGDTPGVFSARVAQVARAVDPATGVGEVRLRLAPSEAAPLLGTAVKVRITLGKRTGAIVVPSGALRRGEDGGPEIVLVEGGKARVRRIRTGLVEEGRVEILSGLSEGEEVVVEDPNGLADGVLLQTRP